MGARQEFSPWWSLFFMTVCLLHYELLEQKKKWFFRTFKRDALWRPFIHYGRLWWQEGWAGLNSVWCEGKPINILTVGEKLLQGFIFILYKMITTGHLTVISMMSKVGYLQTSSKCLSNQMTLGNTVPFFSHAIFSTPTLLRQPRNNLPYILPYISSTAVWLTNTFNNV